MLPGGLWEHGERQRDYAFRPVDGALELRLAEAADADRSLPDTVTRVLTAALARLGGAAATDARVRELCVGDRQFLMRELQRHLGQQGFWGSHRCAGCGERFDFRVNYAELPVVEARGSYPWVEVALTGSGAAATAPIRLRLPNGGDQERLARLDGQIEETEAARTLLQWCGAPERLDRAALERIDEAMDAVAPAVVTEIAARCSHCNAQQVMPLEPYAGVGGTADSLLAEIHQLAMHYHWSEADILALPRRRRRRYLELIDRSRGLVQ